MGLYDGITAVTTIVYCTSRVFISGFLFSLLITNHCFCPAASPLLDGLAEA